MIGEELTATAVTESGLFVDRAYALRDTSDGKIATAKNPRKWPNLFDYRAALVGAPIAGMKLPSARITLPDGTTIGTEHPDASRVLSWALKREVKLEKIGRGEQDASNKEVSEEYWLDMEGLEHRDTVTNFTLPEGTFLRHGNRPHPDHSHAPTLAETVSRGPFRGPKVPAKRCCEAHRRF